jgi:hypothetical protein
MPRNGKKAASQYMIRQRSEALTKWVEGFLRDARSRDLSAHTVEFYRAGLAYFEKFAFRPQACMETRQPTASGIRQSAAPSVTARQAKRYAACPAMRP